MPTCAAHVDPFTAVCPGQRHAAYRELAESGPISRIMLPTGQPAWLVTGYHEARAVLTDARFTKGPSPASVRALELTPELAPALNTHMLRFDGADHARLRRLVSAVFTRRRIESLGPRIQRIADELLDAIDPDGGEFDLIRAYAGPLPLIVICELLGVPEEARANFQVWTNVILGAAFADPDEFVETIADSVAYLRDLLDQRRRHPTVDLLSALVAAQEDGDRLTKDELTSMVWMLVAAGHETTVNLIASGVHALLNHPAQLARLQAEPELIDSCVEELLRYESPLQVTFPLLAIEPLEIAGTRIHAGDVVLPGLLAANRDPAHTGDPDTLDIGRAQHQHLAFGHGAHHCLGAPLARLEARIALRTLLQRWPGLRLAAKPEELSWRANVLIHGLNTLPVAPR